MKRPLIEVLPGLHVDVLHAVWCVDDKTWLLLDSGQRHWVPGDRVTQVVQAYLAGQRKQREERGCDQR